jgi:hypothetical protein
MRLELLFAQFQEGRRPVRAGIVDGHGQWCEFLGRFDEAGDIGRVRGVADDMGHPGAGGSEFCGGRRELVTITAGHRDRIAAGGEAAGDGGAEPLRGTDAGNQDAALRRSRLKIRSIVHDALPFGLDEEHHI